MTNTNTMPSNWHNFLRHNENKTELYHFLTDKVAQMFAPNLVLSQRNMLFSALMKLVLMDWINALMRKLTADTDVLVLALSVFAALQEAGLKQMWLAFGQGQSLYWISVHDLFQCVGQENV